VLPARALLRKRLADQTLGLARDLAGQPARQLTQPAGWVVLRSLLRFRHGIAS
jgi:hypothetical protein